MKMQQYDLNGCKMLFSRLIARHFIYKMFFL